MVKKNEHVQRSECPIACGLDIVGDHWSLLIVRDLMFMERHEFGELLNAAEGISSNILTDRLRKLSMAGIIDSVPHPDSKQKRLYYLTARGKDLIYVLFAIGRWTTKHIPSATQTAPIIQELSAQSDDLVSAIFDRLADWEKRVGIV